MGWLEVAGEGGGGWTEQVAMTALPPQRGSSHGKVGVDGEVVRAQTLELW